MKTASQQASKPTCQRDRHAARRPPSGDVHPRCQEHLKLRRTICRGLARELCRTSGGRRGLMSVCCHWLRRGASMLFFGILLHRFVSCACGHRIRQRCGSSWFFGKSYTSSTKFPAPSVSIYSWKFAAPASRYVGRAGRPPEEWIPCMLVEATKRARSNDLHNLASNPLQWEAAMSL